MAEVRRYKGSAVLAVMLLAGILHPVDVPAQQGTSSATVGSQSDQSTQQTQAKMALVGAGTADGVTNGVSGPDEGGGGGGVEVPPPPSADACGAYQDSPAYDACLAVVLLEQ